jgi:hypothetical protein
MPVSKVFRKAGNLFRIASISTVAMLLNGVSKDERKVKMESKAMEKAAVSVGLVSQGVQMKLIGHLLV